tara:strand:- start:260 stop:877 length:618 start_codon:yes stop_codon:yes gene_type:complete
MPFGVMASPALARSYAGIAAGRPWAADCGVFTGRYDLRQYLAWLDAMQGWRDTCLFVVCPDVVGNSRDTRAQWQELAPLFKPWPRAFVAQDGQEDYAIPTAAEALFIGGTTMWKLGPGALKVIAGAGRRHVHIGRVNRRRRYRHFHGLEGSWGWTCDGTTQRYMGLARALKNWRTYMAEPVAPYLPLFGRDRGGQSTRGDVRPGR